MTPDKDSCDFDVVLPDGRTVRVDVEPTRTTAEIAEVVARKAGIQTRKEESVELYSIPAGEALTGIAAQLPAAVEAGEKIGLRVVPSHTPSQAGVDKAQGKDKPMAKSSKSAIWIFAGAVILAAAITFAAVIISSQLGHQEQAKAPAPSDTAAANALGNLMSQAMAKKKEQMEDPRWWLAKAKPEAHLVSDPRWRSISLRIVACSQAKVGDVAGAKDTAKVIPEDRQKTRAYRAIAEAQAKAGDIAGAIATADAMADGSWKRQAYTAIAVAQAKTGNVSAARATIKGMGDSRWDGERAFLQVAEVLAHRGDFTAARAIVPDVSASGKWEVYAAIGAAQLKGLDTATAQESFRWGVGAVEGLDSKRRWQAYLSIAELQLKGGDTAGSRQTLRLAEALVSAPLRDVNESPDPRINLCCEIAVLQAKGGDVAGCRRSLGQAIALARNISDTLSRAWAYADIAHAQAKAGEADGCRRSALAVMTILKTHGQAQDAQRVGSIRARIARAQALIGDFGSAWETAGGITEERGKSYALLEIAKAYGAMGRTDEAMKAAGEIPQVHQKCTAYCAIGETLAKSGGRETEARQCFALARKAASGGGELEVDSSITIALSQARAGQLAEVEAWIRDLDRPLARCLSYVGAALGIAGVKPD